MDVFAAIADPNRRKMLDLLRSGEAPAGDFVAAFAHLSQPAVSRHLRVLREAGLVRMRAEDRRRLYSLRAQGLRALEDWLSRYREFWPSKLDALEKYLDARAAKSPRR